MWVSLFNISLSNRSKGSSFYVWAVQLPPSSTYHNDGYTAVHQSVSFDLMTMNVVLAQSGPAVQVQLEPRTWKYWKSYKELGWKCPVLTAVTLVHARRKTEAACPPWVMRNILSLGQCPPPQYTPKLTSGRTLILWEVSGYEWFCFVLFVFWAGKVWRLQNEAQWYNCLPFQMLKRALLLG